MSQDWETDWILYSFEPPLNLKTKMKTRDQNHSESNNKGCCPKCQRQIGRGIAIHMKYCRG